METIKRNYKLYSFVAFLCLLIGFFVYVISPFLEAILIAVFVYILTLPVYNFLKKRVKNDTVASSLMCIAILLIILIPIFFLLGKIVDQAIGMSTEVSKNFEYITQLPTHCEGYTTTPCRIVHGIESIVGKLDIEKYSLKLQEVGGYILEKSTKLVITFSSAIIDIFAMVVTLFFLYRDGGSFTHRIDRLVPLQRDYWEAIKRQIVDIVQGILYGSFLTALMVAMIGGFLFWVFGLQNPLLWGTLMGVFAFIPMVGTPIIFIPATLALIVDNRIIAALFFFVLQSVQVIYIDTYLKPKIIGNRVGVHPLVIFFSFFGGLVVFGLIGAIVGPLVAALLVAFVRIYSIEFG